MAIINVSMPDPMRAWVDAQVERGRYHDVSDYLGELIRRDQADADQRHAIVAALIEGEQSGIASRQVPEILAALKAEFHAETE